LLMRREKPAILILEEDTPLHLPNRSIFPLDNAYNSHLLY
jgi:hypothetical protein